MKNIIIGIDFSKETFDATVLDLSKTNGVLSANIDGMHQKFQNGKLGFRQLLRWVKTSTRQRPSKDWMFCGEQTGKYSHGLCDFLSSNGLDMWCEAPLRIKRCMGIARSKNDSLDSLRIAEYAYRYQDKMSAYKPVSKAIAQLKELFLARLKFVEQRKALYVRNNTCTEYSKGSDAEKMVAELSQKLIEQFDESIKKLDKEMQAIIDSDEEILETFENISSIKGISLINASAFIIYTNNFKDFGADPRRIAAYWGVAVFAQDSGTSVHHPARTSPMCSKMLKSLLSEAAVAAKTYNPGIKQYYDRLIAKGKHKGVALNNVKNKLVHIITALAVNKTKYMEGYESFRKAS